jgi:hypothetical protein
LRAPGWVVERTRDPPQKIDGAPGAIRTPDLQIRRQVLLHLAHNLFEAIGDVQRAAVGLAADVEQHRVYPFGGDDVEDGFRAALHPGEVPDPNRMRTGNRHREVLDVCDGMQAAVHDGEVQRVVLLVHAGRGNEVVPGQLVGDLLEAEVRSLQPARVHDDVVLRRAPAHQVHARHARDAEEARLEVVTGNLPQLGDAALRTGEAHPDDRERGEGQPPDRRARGRRQRRTDLCKAAVHVKLRLDHVDVPVEEDADLRRTAPRRGADRDRTGDVLHRLFDGPRDGRHHLVGRHHAVVHEDDDAREIRLREYRRRHPERRVDPGAAEGNADESDG